MSDLGSFDWYRGNLEWLPKRTIFLTRHGSYAYGTNLPDSDIDLKGVAIAPRGYYLGFFNNFEQAEIHDPVDAVIYDIKKFFKLAADCNPNIIEVLFTDPEDHIELPAGSIGKAPWRQIQESRDLFLSQKARHTFSGYAHAQLKRIQTHRHWLLNPPAGQPRRTDFGLPGNDPTIGKEQLGVINARIRKNEDALAGKGATKDLVAEIDDSLVTMAVEELNLSHDLIQVILAERRYASACRNWDSYRKWKEERNEARAALEVEHGYDTKHGMHLVRLMRMAAEILSGQGVKVRRADAKELLEIRAGAWKFDDLMQWAKNQEEYLKTIKSPLPWEASKSVLDDLLVRVMVDALA